MNKGWIPEQDNDQSKLKIYKERPREEHVLRANPRRSVERPPSHLISASLRETRRSKGIYAGEVLPWKSGGHVEQDAPPLLPLVELPDARRAIPTPTHEPEAGKAAKVTLLTWL